jgi:hypothetical protein
MSHLDTISRQGILISIRYRNLLWFDPQELITDEIRQLAEEHKDELITEIKELPSVANISASELLPAYRFLWVATDLSSFEDTDPRYGYEVGRNPVYRMLDAPYYAWLRHQMENAKKAYSNGALSDDEYAIIKDRFNVIHEWAVVHIGEEALRKAIRTTNIKRYAPPSDATIDAYYRTWAEAREANRAKAHHAWEPTEAAKLVELLATQRYAPISSPIIDDVVIIVRDDEVALPAKWIGKVKFTLGELSLMTHLSVESVKQIFDVKDIFGGKVVPPGGSNQQMATNNTSSDQRTESQQTKQTVQGSIF